MLAAVGIALVLAVFIAGMVVVTMTLWGARASRRSMPTPAPRPPQAREKPAELPPKQTNASVLRQVNDREIELEIRGGRVINAIRLYQEKTGAGPQEARDAVEAWRDRLHAS